MIAGIGTDIIEISRIEKFLSQQTGSGLKRVFTQREIDYCSKKVKNAESFAGRFAAKEALFKATGLGWRDGLKWTDFEIINNEFGKPEVFLQGKSRELFGTYKIHLSISHNRSHAIGFAVLEKNK